ncbi:MAG TPA: tRNA(His) guanylyltransferase Thg1 family protein [Bryobacteraceae bacterium]|nr:tRNA(His) guanylyltransferase Thg1 family protein [Bryobacteraceae bacterium]
MKQPKQMAQKRKELDPIGHRMKTRYEAAFRTAVPQRTYLIVRVDGRSFHTYTRSAEKPYDREIAQAMDEGALAVCSEMMGCRFAYGQSDEYSFLATDFDSFQSQMWFNGSIQKIASISASIFTAAFNLSRLRQQVEAGRSTNGFDSKGLLTATFDTRVFVIPSRTEVRNYFIWRQQDASRNSLNMLASCHFSHKELQHATSSERHELLHGIGINWNDCPTEQKRGRVIRRQERSRQVSYVHKKTQEPMSEQVIETFWELDSEIPVFTQDPSYLDGLVPVQE